MDNLWKKDNGCGNYVDLFKYIPPLPISNRNGLQKNNIISTQLRNKGNQKFLENDWIGAMEDFNKSLCFAEYDTENVSLVYAHRSNCFLKLEMYDKCLTDIELATSMDLPDDLMVILKRRKLECMKLMKRTQQEPIHERKLSNPNKLFPSLADVADIQQNEEFGRHIIAKCDLSVDTVILVEEAFVSSTLSGALAACDTCQKTRMNFIPCDKCTLVIFCSENCMKTEGFHRYDCNFVYDRIETKNKEMQMIAKTIFFGLDALGSVDNLMKFCVDCAEKDPEYYLPEKLDDAISKYHLLLTLNGTIETDKMILMLINAKHLYTALLKLLPINTLFDDEGKQRFLMHLVAMHVIMVGQNSIVAKQNQCQQISTLGLVFPLFNHSCSANLLNFSINGGMQFCITMRPVKKGEQLFVSYSCTDMPTRQRQIKLMKDFGFLCNCDKCEPKYKKPDVERLINEPEYKYLIKQRKINSNLMDHKIRMDIEEKCIILLNKHGQLWMPELEMVLEMYTNCELYKYYTIDLSFIIWNADLNLN